MKDRDLFGGVTLFSVKPERHNFHVFSVMQRIHEKRPHAFAFCLHSQGLKLFPDLYPLNSLHTLLVYTSPSSKGWSN